MNPPNTFVLIVGATGSGKSALGLKLAQHFKGSILNCDSLQVYRRLDIGTAKPPAEERKLVPHFLFDVLKPGELLTAGDFRKLALEVLETELRRAPVFGVGGSGFYIQALEKGMFDSGKSDPAVEKRVRDDLEKHGGAALFKELQALDPEYAQSISPNDTYRVTRALIVIHGTGRKLSELRAEFQGEKFPYPLVKIGISISRDMLLPRVEKRTREMLEAGLLDEVCGLVEDGFGAWPALQSVGYKEALQCLNGELVPTQLAAKITEKTMQLAKKQKTWFKRDPGIHWLSPESAFEDALEIINKADRTR